MQLHTVNGTKYGSAATLTCVDGYGTSDSLDVRCQTNGVWDTLPTCTMKGKSKGNSCQNTIHLTAADKVSRQTYAKSILMKVISLNRVEKQFLI